MMGAGGSNSCFPSGLQAGLVPIYGVSEDHLISSSADQATNNSSLHIFSNSSFLYNLSFLEDKVHQLQSLASIIFISPNYHQGHGQPSAESTTMGVASMGTVIQEIIVTASSMMFTCQQRGLGVIKIPDFGEERSGRGLYSNHDQANIDDHHWYGTNSCNTGTIPLSNIQNDHEVDQKVDPDHVEGLEQVSRKNNINSDIVELGAADLLAKYTHYCQICGKGFKRDANLKMHMRAHGDEYKSSAALSNPHKNSITNHTNHGSSKSNDQSKILLPRKYSCPQEGCRWNKKHAKFQPLKSMICVKNHYKRSHCPKMYVCKRCNKKEFSVLSDLRTHEKHCGDLKWKCSCGTTFSRKDKLMGHVALFVGHTPAITSLAKMGKTLDQNHNAATAEMQ